MSRWDHELRIAAEMSDEILARCAEDERRRRAEAETREQARREEEEDAERDEVFRKVADAGQSIEPFRFETGPVESFARVGGGEQRGRAGADVCEPAGGGAPAERGDADSQRTGRKTMTPDHREKLLKLVRLANFLDDLPHDRFHMPFWSSRGATRYSCGTAGCAAGWAATIFSKDWEFYLGAPLLQRVPRRKSDMHTCPDFAAYFGIREDEAHAIALGMTCDFGGFVSYIAEYGIWDGREDMNDAALRITPRHAADRIRKVVARYDPALLEDRTKPAVPASACVSV